MTKYNSCYMMIRSHYIVCQVVNLTARPRVLHAFLPLSELSNYCPGNRPENFRVHLGHSVAELALKVFLTFSSLQPTIISHHTSFSTNALRDLSTQLSLLFSVSQVTVQTPSRWSRVMSTRQRRSVLSSPILTALSHYPFSIPNS